MVAHLAGQGENRPPMAVMCPRMLPMRALALEVVLPWEVGLPWEEGVAPLEPELEEGGEVSTILKEMRVCRNLGVGSAVD